MRSGSAPGRTLRSVVVSASMLCLLAGLALPAEVGVSSGKTLGTTQAAHALTRGHNRKVVHDATRGRCYLFWLKLDGSADPPDGMVYQFSGDGKRWSKPAATGFVGGGATAFDVIEDPPGFYALGLSEVTAAGASKYAVRRFDVNPDGSLLIGPPSVVFDSANQYDVHFYGSLVRDGQGAIWVAARVGDATPGTHAEVIRTTAPDSLSGWGPGACTGGGCNDAWANPYPRVSLEQGTIASRLLDLGARGVGLMTYNKRNGSPAAFGQILFSLNPTRAHGGWGDHVLLLTDQANQYDGANAEDSTRLDDRRFAALVDPRTGVIHVAYIGRDTRGVDSGILRTFTLSPPYSSLADKSAEQVLVPTEVDGVHMSIDTRADPSVIYLFYVDNQHPDYPIRMLENPGLGWEVLPRTITQGAGVRRYPQVPLAVSKNKILLAFEQDHTNQVTRALEYQIRVVKVKLH